MPTPRRQRTIAKPTAPKRPKGGIPKSPEPVAKATDTDGNISDTSAASSTSSRPGLPGHLIKQLLKDIEHPGFGGLQRLQSSANGGEFRILTKLLDSRDDKHELYGEPGSIRRRKVQKYVDRWRKYPKFKYLDLLEKYGVKPSGDKSNLKKSRAENSDISEDSGSVSSDSFEYQKPKAKSQASKAQGGIPEVIQAAEKPSARKLPQRPPQTQSNQAPRMKSHRSSMDLPRGTSKLALNCHKPLCFGY